MISNDFLKYVLAEFAKRPFSGLNGTDDSVIIYKPGDNKFIIQSLVLNDGEVLGKLNGELTPIAMPFQEHFSIVDAGSFDTVISVARASLRSFKFVVELVIENEDPEHRKSLTFEILARIKSNSDIEYAQYAMLGDELDYSLDFSYVDGSLRVIINNNELYPMSVYVSFSNSARVA